MPRIYVNTYVKNNKPTKYVNLIINYFNHSKTIYLGKRNELKRILRNLSLNDKSFKATLISYLRPVVLTKCSQLRNKSEFISLKFNSKSLFTSDNNLIKENELDSFSSYLRQFD